MTISDPIAELLALLAADPAVNALTGGRVFGDLTDQAREGMPQPTVIVAPAGGPGKRGYERTRRTRVDTICYGATLEQSWHLHAAVRELLEAIRRSGSLFSAQTITDGTNRIDPLTLWPTCFASYQVLSADSTD